MSKGNRVKADQRDKRSKALERLAVAVSNFGYALAVAELFERHTPGDSDPMQHALTAALVVSYGRPFTQNFRLGALPPKFVTALNQDRKRVHTTLMDMRNKVVAHSEREYRDVVVLPAGYTTPAGPTLTKATTAVATHQFTLKGPKTIRSHIQRLKAEVQADLDVQIERLFRALKGEPSHPVNALGEEQQWTPNQPPTPFPLPGDPTT